MAPRRERRRTVGRRWPARLVVLLLIVVLLAVFFSSRRNGGQLAGVGQPERGASRATPAVSGSVGALGSGASLDGGWYRLYFTAPRYPDNPANHHGGLDAKLAELMDTATTTLDVADYDFDLANVADAMARAAKRGVRVRMVTDSDTLNDTKNQAIQAALATVRGAGITIVGDNRGPIMHDKFTVVDGEWVETGSWNYTDGDTYRLNNNMIMIHSRELAANYTAEFERMFVKKQFGPNKDKTVPYPVVTIDGTRIENYFAPRGNVASHIVDTIARSQRSIDFLAFSFTSDKIAKAMLDRHQAGVTVSGVFETTGSNTQFSEYTKMKRQGLPVYQDGNPWVMHHKVIIIDERIVIFGSFNFSDNADTQNDENLLIVDNPDIARAFKAEFDRVLALAQNPPVKK